MSHTRRGAAAGASSAPGGAVRSARFAELDAATLYEILRLRVDVFVVEQRCAYRELDGRDTEPTTRHLWIAGDDGTIRAYLRALDDGGGFTRIGRVVTNPAHRGHGLADRLVRHAVAAAPGPVVASAQAHLQRWYEQLGFVVTGVPYDEDGIPHVAMRHGHHGSGRTP